MSHYRLPFLQCKALHRGPRLLATARRMVTRCRRLFNFPDCDFWPTFALAHRVSAPRLAAEYHDDGFVSAHSRSWSPYLAS
jgi:hypothetical protein